jgi:hypothetical protein
MEAEAIAQTELSEVPSAEHWRSFASIPGDFDANAVWSYTQKKIERGKPCSECVFAEKHLRVTMQRRCNSITVECTSSTFNYALDAAMVQCLFGSVML